MAIGFMHSGAPNAFLQIRFAPFSVDLLPVRLRIKEIFQKALHAAHTLNAGLFVPPIPNSKN